MSSGIGVNAAGNPTKTFVKNWEGRRVVLRRTLYTVMYDELGRVGKTHRGKLEGLTVTTPSSGTYFLFSGRLSEDDITDRDPNRLLDLVTARYRRAFHLDVGTVEQIKPTMLMRYEPGVALTVRSVHVERDRVRLVFHKLEPADHSMFATTLTVKWPVPLSKDLSERMLVDGVIHQFLEVRQE